MLHNWAEGSKKSSGLCAEFYLCNPRPLRIFPPEAWERIVAMVFFAYVHELRAALLLILKGIIGMGAILGQV